MNCFNFLLNRINFAYGSIDKYEIYMSNDKCDLFLFPVLTDNDKQYVPIQYTGDYTFIRDTFVKQRKDITLHDCSHVYLTNYVFTISANQKIAKMGKPTIRKDVLLSFQPYLKNANLFVNYKCMRIKMNIFTENLIVCTIREDLFVFKISSAPSKEITLINDNLPQKKKTYGWNNFKLIINTSMMMDINCIYRLPNIFKTQDGGTTKQFNEAKFKKENFVKLELKESKDVQPASDDDGLSYSPYFKNVTDADKSILIQAFKDDTKTAEKVQDHKYRTLDHFDLDFLFHFKTVLDDTDEDEIFIKKFEKVLIFVNNMMKKNEKYYTNNYFDTFFHLCDVSNLFVVYQKLKEGSLGEMNHYCDMLDEAENSISVDPNVYKEILEAFRKFKAKKSKKHEIFHKNFIKYSEATKNYDNSKNIALKDSEDKRTHLNEKIKKKKAILSKHTTKEFVTQKSYTKVAIILVTICSISVIILYMLMYYKIKE